MDSSSEVINLPDFDAVTFETIIKSIYSGYDPNVHLANYYDLLNIGEFLGVSRIVEKCERFISDNVEQLSDDIFEVFSFACSTSSYLKSQLSSYILHRFHTLVECNVFFEIR